jgi:hypothetical protein
MHTVLTTLPLLACPVGMGLMMLKMRPGKRDAAKPSQPASIEVLREEHARLGSKIEGLEQRQRDGAAH